jgi:hypothetical protein
MLPPRLVEALAADRRDDSHHPRLPRREPFDLHDFCGILPGIAVCIHRIAALHNKTRIDFVSASWQNFDAT